MSVRKTILYGNSVSKNSVPDIPKDAKVILPGEFMSKKAGIGLTDDTLSKHMMLVGGTGCGKSTLFYHIISQIKASMSSDDVMIIFDTKGDYYSKFANSSDLVIGNSMQYRQNSQRWNVFRELLADGWDDKQIQVNAQELCKGLFADRLEGSNNPFFPNAARDLLASILLVILRDGQNDTDYRNKMCWNSSLRETVDSTDIAGLIDAFNRYSDMTSIISYIDGNNDQSQGVMAEMNSVVRDLFMGVFAEKGNFSIRDFVRKKEGKTLFVEYDLSIGSVLTPVYRALFDLALKEAMGRNKSSGNVYLVCDEFKLLPRLEHIDDGVNFGRSLGVKVFAGLQSIEQLFEAYGESRGKNLAAGFSTMIGFRANDVTTRDYMSKLYGANLVLEQYQKVDGSIVQEQRTGNTVEDWDMNDLRVGEAIVGLPFSQPFRFRFDMYNDRIGQKGGRV